MASDYNFIFSKRLPLRPRADTLASRQFKRLVPKRIKDRVAKGYTLATVKWATRNVFRNGLHRRRREQAFAHLRTFFKARAANHRATGRFYAASRAS